MCERASELRLPLFPLGLVFSVVTLKGSGVGPHGAHERTGHQSGTNMEFTSEIGARVVLVVVSRMATLGGWCILLVFIDGEDVELAIFVLAWSVR